MNGDKMCVCQCEVKIFSIEKYYYVLEHNISVEKYLKHIFRKKITDWQTNRNYKHKF